MIIMRSEGKFLRHFKEAAPLAVSTFGSKIGHLTLRMILHSSSKKVGLVAHHYHHFVRATLQSQMSVHLFIWKQNPLLSLSLFISLPLSTSLCIFLLSKLFSIITFKSFSYFGCKKIFNFIDLAVTSHLKNLFN